MNVVPAGSSETQSHSKYDRLIAAAKAVPVPTIVVVSPCDETSLRGVVDSAGAGFIDPVLVGPEAKITVSATARSASRTTWSRHH